MPIRHHARRALAAGHAGHGAKFAFADPATWPAPTTTLHTTDDQYGTVTVHAWAGLHPKQHRHPGHGSGRPRPIVRGTIPRVQVQRVPARTRPPKVLWLWWAGPGQPDLERAWRAYTPRFDLEHTLRFCKQTLGWVTPRVRHPEQAERWTWLVLAAYAQLRLARQLVADQRLAWERPRPPGQLSPYRVRRGFPGLLCARLAGRRAEALRALPRSPQGPPVRPRPAPPCHQEAHQETQEEAAHHQGGLSGLTRRHARQPPPTGPRRSHRAKTQA